MFSLLKIGGPVFSLADPSIICDGTSLFVPPQWRSQDKSDTDAGAKSRFLHCKASPHLLEPLSSARWQLYRIPPRAPSEEEGIFFTPNRSETRAGES